MLFQTTRNILFELKAASRIGELLVREGASKRVLVVSDPGIQAAGLLDSALASIRTAGGSVALFTDVSPNPTEANILSAKQAAIDSEATAVVGLGGGSPMDVAKLAAFLATNPNVDMKDVYGVGKCERTEGHNARLPLIQVPTTAGTGSEVTPISIVTTGAASKMGVVSAQLLPDWAVLDGELTLGLPQMTTAHTGVDAMVHAIEAYTCATTKNTLSDALAKEALRHLSENIRAAVFDGRNDADARAGMLLGSMYAGMAFANAPVAAVHALAYPIGARFSVPHGLSCSLMLPPVIDFNKSCALKEYAELADVLFPERVAAACSNNSSAASDTAKTDALVAGISDLVVELGLPTQLSHPEIGIEETDIPMLAAEAMKQVRLLPNNPRLVTEEDAVGIYRTLL